MRAPVMKDASSTDVVVHRGRALTSFYQCGDMYRIDPFTGIPWAEDSGRLPVRLGGLGASERRRSAYRRVAVFHLQQGARRT